MQVGIKLRSVIASLALLAPATAAEPPLPAAPKRGLVDGVFVSAAMPELRIRIDERFRYLGRDRFILKGIAHVDRHHWVAVREDGSSGEGNLKDVEAMIVLQFEGFLDGIDNHYRYRVPSGAGIAGANYRFSPEAVDLGGAASPEGGQTGHYIHNTWAYDNADSVCENPGAEADRTRRFLSERGYRLDDERIMSRFVRVVGEERRDELIIFYLEPLSAHGHRVEEFPDGGPVNEVFDALSESIRQRSLDSFRILDSDP